MGGGEFCFKTGGNRGAILQFTLVANHNIAGLTQFSVKTRRSRSSNYLLISVLAGWAALTYLYCSGLITLDPVGNLEISAMFSVVTVVLALEFISLLEREIKRHAKRNHKGWSWIG